MVRKNYAMLTDYTDVDGFTIQRRMIGLLGANDATGRWLTFEVSKGIPGAMYPVHRTVHVPFAFAVALGQGHD